MDIMKTPRSICFLVDLPNIAMKLATLCLILSRTPIFAASAASAGSFLKIGLCSKSFSLSAFDTPNLSQTAVASCPRPLNASQRGNCGR
jgi:hypothetical protein